MDTIFGLFPTGLAIDYMASNLIKCITMTLYLTVEIDNQFMILMIWKAKSAILLLTRTVHQHKFTV